MQHEILINPNFLFEVSWEVCNKVGGIHTVIATKTTSLEKLMKGTHFVIGPDLGQDNSTNSEFKEDSSLFPEWKKIAEAEGLKIRIGRWNIPKKPIAILVDFAPFFDQKDQILGDLWNTYRLDSLSGQWDYIEPAMFGYAAGKVIDSYTRAHCTYEDKVVAQFHEWMTGTGLLYLKEAAPHIATAFTTHATVLGRCIAGNNLPLYDKLIEYNPDDIAREFNVRAKQSLEKCSALEADVFTTVSDITAKECKQFFNKAVDLVTPNGFQDFITNKKQFAEAQKNGRNKLVDVAEAILGYPISRDALLVGTSGRYEFKNKGIDLFIDTLGKLNKDKSLKKEVIGFILVPAGHTGPIPQLLENLTNKDNAQALPNPYLSHGLQDEYNDPSLNRIKENELFNREEDNVKIFFIPSYLNGDDGVFNVPYYELLPGLDLSLFPSYYEPWGYTPLESVAFKVPTITTTLAGFGLWVETYYKGAHPGVSVIKRGDNNDAEVVKSMAKYILCYAKYTKAEAEEVKENAYEVSKIALWDNLASYYANAYTIALKKAAKRTSKDDFLNKKKYTPTMQPSTNPRWHNIIIHRNVPKKFDALEELAKNLWWSWNQEALDLFDSIDTKAWEECKNNPIALLNSISIKRYEELQKDKDFLRNLDNVYAKFKAYMAKKKTLKNPKIAYFCMEYGIHSSLKIYSGGLGILAGDYLKEASDKGTHMAAVGFLYKYGYFTQHLSTSGNQENVYEPQLFDQLPVTPQRDKNGKWITIQVDFPGRVVNARVWRVDVGRVELYLLDTDFEENLPEDRSITHHLYGGDWENRLKQEILLGIGGIRVMNEVGYEADVYHCNEGHAAMVSFERIHNLMVNDKLTFDEAQAVVRSSSLFTTHTPVPAGHDAFDENLFHKYMYFYPERFKISWERIIGLGRVNADDHNEKFSMSNLAIRMSQEVNGVSWLHGKVSQQMFQSLCPGYLVDEVPVGYVTNGVHHPTWTAPEWKNLILRECGDDLTNLQYDKECFSKIQKVDSKEIWGIRNILRNRLVEYIKSIMSSNIKYYTPREIVEIVEKIDPNKLTIGFARRFATYKRATLILRDLDTLDKIVNNPDRPVQFFFAGKAHPADQAGQDLIKRIVEVSKYPQFIGKIIFLENYDMDIASKLVQGVDIWLNTPTRPMEASGTSGEKAVMNGVMHFSVLDGWWVEGYKEGAGWMLPLEQVYENNDFQNELDAEIVYATIQNEIAPQFYNRDAKGIPVEWIHTIKNSIEHVASNFTMNRMLVDYEERYYNKLEKRHKQIKKDDYAMAKELVAWEHKIAAEWNNIQVKSISSFNPVTQTIYTGDQHILEVILDCAGLESKDVAVELMLMHDDKVARNDEDALKKVPFKCISTEGTTAKYQLEYTPVLPGTYSTGIRIYPTNKLLACQQEISFVKWL